MTDDKPQNTNFRTNKNTLVKCSSCQGFIDSINSAVLVWRVTIDGGQVLYTDHRVVHDSAQCKNTVFKEDHYLWKLVSNNFQNGKLNFDRLFDRNHVDKYHQIDESSVKTVMPALHLLLQRWYFRQEKLEAMRIAAEKAREENARIEKLAAERKASEQATARKVAEEKIRMEKLATQKAKEERLAAEKLAAKRINVMKILEQKEAEERAKKGHLKGQPKTRAGYVYLLQSPTGYYKIGRTKNPSDRIKTFNIKLPFEVEYIAIIATLDMVQLETELHRKYSTKRIDGEWFELAPADIAYIKGLAT